jgi:hypothetical protein
MNKFGKPTDEEYRTVCDAITDIVDTISSLPMSKRGQQHDAPQELAPMTPTNKEGVLSDL